jgi:hypothetical protein
VADKIRRNFSLTVAVILISYRTKRTCLRKTFICLSSRKTEISSFVTNSKPQPQRLSDDSF